MYILLVEDDYLQADWIEASLKTAFGNIQVERIATEQEFYARVPEIVANPPDVIVIDVMLRWTDPSREMVEPPPAVEKDGFYRAGIRCQEKLAEQKETSQIPIVLYTVLERIDLEQEIDGLSKSVTYLRKDSDSTSLTDQIRVATSRRIKSS
jgi:DNA-binding response OmpR family regulator